MIIAFYDSELLAIIITCTACESSLISKSINDHSEFFFLPFVPHLERGMAETEGSGGPTRINEARCHGAGGYRVLECTRRSSTSIAGELK